MPEDPATTPPNDTAPPTITPPAPPAASAQPPVPAPAPTRAQNDDLIGLSPAELVGIIKDTRRQVGGYRARITTLEGEAKSIVTERDTLKSAQQQRDDDEARKRGEFEKIAEDAKKRADRAEAAVKAKEAEFVIFRKRDAVRVEAMKAGINNPADVNFLDIASLPEDEHSLAAAAVELVAKTKAERAYWFKAPEPPPPPPPVQNTAPPQPHVLYPYLAAPPPLPAPGANPPAQKDARQMTDAEYAALDARMMGRV